MSRDPTGDGVGEFIGILGIGCLIFLPISIVLVLFKELPMEGKGILAIITIALVIIWTSWSRKTRPARLLKRILREREELHANLDSRTWWSVFVTIPDSAYGGGGNDSWECDVSVYADNEETAKRKAINLVRRRNHKYDDMREEMNRQFYSGIPESSPVQESALIIDGPFKVLNHGRVGGTQLFQKCDPHKFDKQIRQLEWAIKNRKY